MEVVTWALVGVAQQLNRWSIAANEHDRSSAPFPSRQRAAFSRELFLCCFCQKSTGAFIETNCLWAQLSAIDKLIMQMRDCVQDVAVWQCRKSHADLMCARIRPTGTWCRDCRRNAVGYIGIKLIISTQTHPHCVTTEKWSIKSESFDVD